MLLMRRNSNFLDLKGTEDAHALAFSRANESMKNKRRASPELRHGDELESRLSLDHLIHVEEDVISRFYVKDLLVSQKLPYESNVISSGELFILPRQSRQYCGKDDSDKAGGRAGRHKGMWVSGQSHKNPIWEFLFSIVR